MGDEETGADPIPLDDGVHRKGRPVDEGGDRSRVDLSMVDEFAHPVQNSLRRGAGNGRGLEVVQLIPGFVGDDEVSEGAADIDADPQFRMLPRGSERHR